MGLFKDFVKNIGGVAKDSVLAGVTKGIRNSQLSSNLPVFGDINVENGFFSNDIIPNEDLSLFGITPSINTDFFTYDKLFDADRLNDVIKNEVEINDESNKKKYSGDQQTLDSNEYKLRLPNWNYGDFINERNIFIKHLSNGYDEPGWFYFKIFFDFSSNHGLFGGILNSPAQEDQFNSVNSATDYLLQCKEIFAYEKLQERMICLQRFTRLLSYININAPWFFKSVKNLSEISKPKFANLTEDKSIEIELDQDAVDMRISTLLSLYKYVCYDDINNKEILPENLRKFDMCIIIFSAPIKFIHNTYQNNKFKSIYNNVYQSNNLMSFKLYKLLNCEIDIESLGAYMNDDIKNEQPFGLGQGNLKIKYDRAYEYIMNEYIGFMFGSDGIYLDSEGIELGDITDLTILSEQKIHDNINKLLGNDSRFVLGNINHQDRQIYTKEISQTKMSKTFTEYAKTKYGIMSGNKNFILNTGYNMLYKLLGTGYNANAEVLKVGGKVIGDGTVLNGHGDYRVGSAVWRAKMKRLVTGSTQLSDREIRLGITGKAFHTDWMYNLQNRAINATPTII